MDTIRPVLESDPDYKIDCQEKVRLMYCLKKYMILGKGIIGLCEVIRIAKVFTVSPDRHPMTQTPRR